MDRIAVKVHKTDKGHVLGACDVELLGKKLKHGGIVIEVRENFYFERHVGPDELAELVEGCMTANIIGKRAIEAYCKANPDSRDSVVDVGGVPHLLVFKL